MPSEKMELSSIDKDTVKTEGQTLKDNGVRDIAAASWADRISPPATPAPSTPQIEQQQTL